jgi:predicted MPP superfamily phosphohydrolase
VLIGYFNAVRPRVTKLEIDIPKKAGKLQSLRIALVTDIHLGTMVGRNRMSYIVERINEMKPDIVLLAGDVVDEDIDPVIRLNLGQMLLSLNSRYGTYAVTGNHEYIGGAERSIAYLQAHGVRVLRDSTTRIDSSFLLVGRDDKDRRRHSGTGTRAELSQLLSEEDFSQPVILLDHQPFALNKAVEAGIDLQLSGHTHAGQIWPLNYITRGIFEVDHGYLKKGNTHFYVSNGAGTWGPPIRIGNTPEIVEITLRFR